MAGGRPSKYDPKFCETIVEKMALGYSMTAAASQMDVHKDTLTNWAKEHPEFFNALKRAKAKRLFKLETDLLEAKSAPQVTSRIFALKNADPDEWRDKVDHEHAGPGGGAIVFKTVYDAKE